MEGIAVFGLIHEPIRFVLAQLKYRHVRREIVELKKLIMAMFVNKQKWKKSLCGFFTVLQW